MKKFFEEFKAFIARGNVVDMAVAVIIGGAFSKIVTSLVNDMIMPCIGLITGGLNVSDWKYVFSPAVLDATGAEITAENALRYGVFLQAIIDFLIVAFCIFVMLKVVMKVQDTFRKKEEATEEAEEEAKGPTSEELLTEIRDLLKEKKD